MLYPMQAADVADAFDRLPDDTAPTLLALLDSLDDEDATVIADARPVSYQVTSCAEEVAGTSTESKAKTKTKKTWRQRQRLEVLRLRDEVQELDAELKKLMLVAGVRSTVPERAGTTETPNVDALHAPPASLAMEDSDGIPVYPGRGAVTASQRTSAELSRIMIRQEQRKQRVDERAEAIAKAFTKAQADGRTRTRAFRRHERHLIRQTFGISPDTSDDDAGEGAGVLSGGEEAGDGEEET
ncbi:hypothetical protein PF001_g18816, partial [Phytophthora fragariae]